MVKYWAKIIIRFLLKVFWIFPVNENKYVFVSNLGKQYSCNPKAFSQYVMNNHDTITRVWLLEKAEDKSRIKENAETAKMKSLKGMYHLLTAGVLVMNQNVPGYLPVRKKQISINTWHGGGAYKVVHITDKASAKLSYKNTTAMISSSEAFSEIVRNDFGYNGIILPFGMPRNDIFFKDAKSQMGEELKSELGISKNTIVILYAPTFRGLAASMDQWSLDLDFQRLSNVVEREYKNPCTILYRGHIGDIKSDLSSVVRDVSAIDDMQSLLIISDFLITDYSSSVWDRALQKRPAILYAPDLEEYRKTVGFHLDIEKWPFPIACNNDELEQVICEFDQVKLEKACAEHLQSLGSFESGNACEKLYEWIDVYRKRVS